MSETPRTARTVHTTVRDCFVRLLKVDGAIREFQSKPPLTMPDQAIQQTVAVMRSEADSALRQAILAVLDAQLYLLENLATEETEKFRPSVINGGKACH